MGMTSVVLIILALSVRSMAWLDAYLKRREAQNSESSDEEPTQSIDTAPESAELPSADGAARAAAIAVGLSLSQRAKEEARTTTLAAQTPLTGATYDSWLTEGRSRQRSNSGAAQGSRGWR